MRQICFRFLLLAFLISLSSGSFKVHGQYVNEKKVEEKVLEAQRRHRANKAQEENEKKALAEKHEQIDEQAKAQSARNRAENEAKEQNVREAAHQTRNVLRERYAGRSALRAVVNEADGGIGKEKQAVFYGNKTHGARPTLTGLLQSIESGADVMAPGTYLTRAQMDRIGRRRHVFPSELKSERSIGSEFFTKVNEIWNADYEDWFDQQRESTKKKMLKKAVKRGKKLAESVSVPVKTFLNKIENCKKIVNVENKTLTSLLTEENAWKMVETVDNGKFDYYDSWLGQEAVGYGNLAKDVIESETNMEIHYFPVSQSEAVEMLVDYDIEAAKKLISESQTYKELKKDVEQKKKEFKRYVFDSLPEEFESAYEILKY